MTNSSMKLTKEHDQLMDAMLPHVQFDGWCRAALHMGADDIEISKAEADRLFPGDAVDLILYFCRKSDRDMESAIGEIDFKSLKIRERIATVVKTRLMLNSDHREAIRKGVGTMAMPQNSIQSMKSVYHTVDAMWYLAGDNATDWNYYSKRMLLAGVYSSTLLYWLNDTSEDFEATWAFLDRRIADVMKVPKIKAKLSDVVGKLTGLPTLRRKAMNRFKVKSGIAR